MRIVAMLSYYDEEPSLLYDCVARAAMMGADYVVALDGPYALREHEYTISPSECREAIQDAADEAGISCYCAQWRPERRGNEVEKRNDLLRLTLNDQDDQIWGTVAKDGDWLMVLDADHMWERRGNINLFDALPNVPEMIGFVEVAFSDEAPEKVDPHTYPARLLMRAAPGMRYDGAHWRVRMPDGSTSTVIRSHEPSTALAVDLTGEFLVRHLALHLPAPRRERQGGYYLNRDDQGVEK